MSRDPKIDRKALKKPDTFVVKGLQAMNALFLERRNAMVLVGAVVALGGLYYGYDAWHTRALDRDWVSFFKAEDAPEAERVEKLKQTYDKGGSTRAAFLAAVTLGDRYAESASWKVEAERVKAATGKDPKPDTKKKEEDTSKKDQEPSLSKEQAAQAAGEWYGKALKYSGLLPAERELLILDVGHAAELEGKWDIAAQKYKEVVDLGGSSKPLAMLHLGLVHEVKKEKDSAKTLYQNIAQQYASTEYATLAKNYLRRMDSALLVPVAKP